MRTILLIALLATGFSLSAQDQELDAIVKTRDAAVAKANREAVKKLEKLVSARTKKGDLEGAMRAKATIAKLNGEDADNETAASAEPVGKDAVREQVAGRYLAFVNCLIGEDIAGAAAFVDPATRAVLPIETIHGYLQLMAGAIKLAQLSRKQVKVEEVVLGRKGDDARLTPAFFAGNAWESQKPSYWIRRKGQWYLGDEKQLENFQ